MEIIQHPWRNKRFTYSLFLRTKGENRRKSCKQQQKTSILHESLGFILFYVLMIYGSYIILKIKLHCALCFHAYVFSNLRNVRSSLLFVNLLLNKINQIKKHWMNSCTFFCFSNVSAQTLRRLHTPFLFKYKRVSRHTSLSRSERHVHEKRGHVLYVHECLCVWLCVCGNATKTHFVRHKEPTALEQRAPASESHPSDRAGGPWS